MKRTKKDRVLSGVGAVIATGIGAVILGEGGAFARVPCSIWYCVLGIAFLLGYNWGE